MEGGKDVEEMSGRGKHAVGEVDMRTSGVRVKASSMLALGRASAARGSTMSESGSGNWWESCGRESLSLY